jgi:tRNA pseudouridine55 synthase
VLAIDKPEGWTSHDIVAVVRGVLGTKHVGHGGTLDPQATGLLPVLVGTATKFADRIHDATKVYDALVRFGTETATDDREGAVTREADVPLLAAGAIEPALEALRGVIMQIPPQYAALKVGGRTAYSRARGGETVALAARTVQVFRLDMIDISSPDLRLLVVCSSGTYVRSIARDLGRALGSAAHLAALRRLAVGALEARDALTPDQLRARGRAGTALLRPANEDLLTLDPRFLHVSAATIVGAGESS